jgi:hypothetical protein
VVPAPVTDGLSPPTVARTGTRGDGVRAPAAEAAAGSSVTGCVFVHDNKSLVHDNEPFVHEDENAPCDEEMGGQKLPDPTARATPAARLLADVRRIVAASLSRLVAAASSARRSPPGSGQNTRSWTCAVL